MTVIKSAYDESLDHDIINTALEYDFIKVDDILKIFEFDNSTRAKFNFMVVQHSYHTSNLIQEERDEAGLEYLLNIRKYFFEDDDQEY